ncbi:MAG: hypothetical protein AAGK09_02780 [Planctomycetota bacterium]
MDDITPAKSDAKVHRFLGLLSDVMAFADADPAGARYLVQLVTERLDDESACQPPAGSSHPDPDLFEMTHAERLIHHFVMNDNPWLSVTEIREQTKIERGAIAQVLYTTEREKFERKPHPRHARMKCWRLRELVFEQQRELLAKAAAHEPGEVDHVTAA